MSGNDGSSDDDPAGGPYVGSIDQGTTGTRFLVYDRDGRIVARAYASHEAVRPGPGHVEHDPGTLWANTVSVVRRACRRGDVAAADLAAIGVANQRETVLLWDADTGEPLYNAIVWQDTRSADRVEELRDGPLEAVIRDRTGLVPDTYFPAPKLEWLLDRTGARADPESTCFGTVDSWLLYNLTGVHATDVSNASQTMLFDVDALAWDDRLLEAFDVPRAVLPEVRPSSDPSGYGETTLGGFFDDPVPVTGVIGDQQAALLGNACLDPGDVKVTYGSGTFALCNTGTDRVRSENGLLSTVAYQERGEDPVYALEGPIFTGGATFDWLVDVGVLDSAADIETVAERVDSAEGVCLIPGFRGLAAPHWVPGARGLVVGVTPDTDPEHLVRAAIESVAYRVREVLDAMARDTAVEGNEVRVDSGLAENDRFCGLQADVLDARVARSDRVASTAIGAAYVAGRAVDVWDEDGFAACWGAAASFDATRPGTYDERYGQWRRAVDLATRWDADPYAGGRR